MESRSFLSNGPRVKARSTQRAHRSAARAESSREIALVLAVALIGVVIAAAVVLAPWHPAQATRAPVTGFVTNISGDDQGVLIVGTSGWQYRDWKGLFYPPGAEELPYYAGSFTTVELNNSFYRLPSRAQFEQWAAQTPGDFVFAVKMSRYLTHIRRLKDPAEPVQRFLRHASGLGGKLGPVLVQLPPTLPFDKELLHAVLALFPRTIKVAVEPRHQSWWSAVARGVLEKHGAALCWADRLSRPITPLWRTAEFGYVRFHEGRANPRPRYGRGALASWVQRLREFGDDPVYVYFNNDPGGAALHDAAALARLAERRKLDVSRVADL